MYGFGAGIWDAAELVSATRAPSNDAALTAVASVGMSRVQDRPITPSPPASSGLGGRGLVARQTQQSVSVFDCDPFLRPDHLTGVHRAQARSRSGSRSDAPAQRRRRRP